MASAAAAVPRPLASSGSISPSPSPSSLVPTAPLSSLAATHLKNFLGHELTVAAYADAHKPLMAARSTRVQADHSLMKLKAKGNTNPEAPLPVGLRMRFFEKIKMRTYADKPALFKEQLDAMKTIEQETEKKLYALLVQARQTEVDYLNESTGLNRLVSLAKISFNTDVLSPFVAGFCHAVGEKVESTTFPIQAAQAHFADFIQEKASSIMVNFAAEEQQEHKRKEAEQQAASIAAEEGMKNPSLNIEQIATSAANKITHPLMQDLKQQMNQLQQMIQSASIREKTINEKKNGRQQSNGRERQSQRMDVSTSAASTSSGPKQHSGHKRKSAPATTAPANSFKPSEREPHASSSSSSIHKHPSSSDVNKFQRTDVQASSHSAVTGTSPAAAAHQDQDPTNMKQRQQHPKKWQSGDRQHNNQNKINTQ